MSRTSEAMRPTETELRYADDVPSFGDPLRNPRTAPIVATKVFRLWNQDAALTSREHVQHNRRRRRASQSRGQRSDNARLMSASKLHELFRFFAVQRSRQRREPT